MFKSDLYMFNVTAETMINIDIRWVLLIFIAFSIFFLFEKQKYQFINE